MLTIAGATFVVTSGAIICLMVLSIIVSEKSRKLLGFLRKYACHAAHLCA